MGCASGILEVTYGANELNLVETADFPELNDIPSQRISLREQRERKASLVLYLADRPGVHVKVYVSITDAVVEKRNRSVTFIVIKLVLIVEFLNMYQFSCICKYYYYDMNKLYICTT